MPYAFLEEIATADAAFEATGSTPEELFASAARATTAVMVEELDTVRPRTSVTLEQQGTDLDELLYRFLSEIVALKDSELLLLLPRELAITEAGGAWRLRAEMQGEPLDRERHPLAADVKAVTMHRFGVEHAADGWRATVVLDI